MVGRQKRLAALNGERRTFVCAECGKVRHVKDAGARVGRSAEIVCNVCACSLLVLQGLRQHIDALFSIGARTVAVQIILPGSIRKINVKGKLDFTGVNHE